MFEGVVLVACCDLTYLGQVMATASSAGQTAYRSRCLDALAIQDNVNDLSHPVDFCVKEISHSWRHMALNARNTFMFADFPAIVVAVHCVATVAEPALAAQVHADATED